MSVILLEASSTSETINILINTASAFAAEESFKEWQHDPLFITPTDFM